MAHCSIKGNHCFFCKGLGFLKIKHRVTGYETETACICQSEEMYFKDTLSGIDYFKSQGYDWIM